MVCQLKSRMFSSETLVDGVEMVGTGTGLPSPTADTFELMQELASLEAHLTSQLSHHWKGYMCNIWNQH